MTESEWLTSGDWLALWFYSYEVDLRTPRKTRLFAAASCRRFAHRLVDPRCLRAVEACEALADGNASEDDRTAARDGAKFETAPPIPEQRKAVGRAASNATHWICYDESKVGRATEVAPTVHGYEAAVAARLISDNASPDEANNVTMHPIFVEGVARGERIQADILREVIGNPFHPVTINPAVLAWNDATVVRLARAAYDERHLPSGELDPHRLAVLADALDEAGAPTELAAHLRSPGPHVRGCWAVDLCLGLN